MCAVLVKHGDIKQHVQQIKKRLIERKPVNVFPAHQNIDPIGAGNGKRRHIHDRRLLRQQFVLVPVFHRIEGAEQKPQTHDTGNLQQLRIMIHVINKNRNRKNRNHSGKKTQKRSRSNHFPVPLLVENQPVDNDRFQSQIRKTGKEADIGSDIGDFTIVGRTQIPDRCHAHKKADSQLENLVDHHPGCIVQEPVHLCHGYFSLPKAS